MYNLALLPNLHCWDFFSYCDSPSCIVDVWRI